MYSFLYNYLFLMARAWWPIPGMVYWEIREVARG